MTRRPRAARSRLASASPRRRELLEQLGLTLQVAPADIDETPLPGERPADYVRRVAAAKCDAVAAARAPDLRRSPARRRHDRHRRRPDPRPAAPTRSDARRMLLALAGRRHDVTTAYRITLRRPDAGPRGDDHRVVPVAAAGGGRRLPRVAASGAARPAATPCRDARARSSPSCAARTPTSSACRSPRCSPICRRWQALPALPAGGRSASGRGRDARRADRGQPGRRARRASPPPRAPPAARRSPSACSPSARRCRADDVRAAIAAGQRAFGENYAQELRDKSARRWPPDRRCRAARMALHRPAAEQQGEVRRRARSRCCTRSIRPRCSTPIEARGAPQACLIQVNVAGEASKKGVAPARAARRCSIASRRWRTSRCDGPDADPAARRRPPPLRGAARAARSRGGARPPERRPARAVDGHDRRSRGRHRRGRDDRPRRHRDLRAAALA